MSDTLGTIVMDAIKMRDTLKANGLAGDGLDRALESVLRDSWPKPKDRAEPWRDTCQICRDYGLEMLWCPGDATCGPHPVTGAPRKAHASHEYGRPCLCAAGKRHHEKSMPTPDDAMTIAARPKKMSRWGR